jgi:hypothetical protein
MKKSVLFWILAFLVTAVSAVYQRMTGPTYPVTEGVVVGGEALTARLERSHSISSDFTVALRAPDPGVSGTLFWKRLGTADDWIGIPLSRGGDSLSGILPRQPAAGKLLYRIELRGGAQTVSLPPAGAVTVRFKGDVPLPVLILHVVAIFGAMLMSTRTAFEALAERPRYTLFAGVTAASLFIGGLVLGPIVQKYAFDAYWTGWPMGTDLTDNKTAAAFLAWLAAWRYAGRSGRPRWWVVGAAVVTLAVFLIPHSLLGSEYDYSKDGGRP